MTVDAEHHTPLPYGRLDKFTAVKELAAKGFVVPPVFSTVEEAIEWQQDGGKVIARPYFDAPWDSAIFLPGLNSYVLDENCTDLDDYQRQWQDYLQDLHDNNNLLGYLEQFGVSLIEPPQVSYFLQAFASRGVSWNFEPRRSTIIMMDNEDNTHIESQTSGSRTHSGVYRNGAHVLWERFTGFSPSETDDGELDVEKLIDTYQQIQNRFPGDRNLQVEFTYGQLKEGEDSQLYVVQVRDFPQLPAALWEYGEKFEVLERRNYFQAPFVSSINNIDLFKDTSYVLCLDAKGWYDEALINTFQGMKGLWIQDRYAKVPLMHGLFSLIELAHIRGDKVLLG